MGLFFRFGQRVIYAFLLILSLVLFISLAAELDRRGGIQSFSRAVPEALTSSFDFFNALFGGEVELAVDWKEALSRSLGLLTTSLAIGISSGLILGAFAALHRHSRLSSIIISLSVIGVSTPSYVVAMFLIWMVVWIFQRTGVRILPVFGFGWDERLIMPAIVLAARPMANMVRLSFSTLTDVFEADYVRTAHSKGLPPLAVFLHHVLKNAGIPLLTTAAVSLRFSLSTLLIIEYIFNWSGVGLALLRARDTVTTIALIIPLAVLFVGVNLVLEFLYLFIDPRLREEVQG
jgi:peptide/nickel transport system permease protein